MPNYPVVGERMKKLMVLSLFVMLSGCVTYYYPETALEDGVYYAGDDPSYVVHRPVYYGYGGYYPWVSLDYFYMGFNPYPRYAYFHVYPYGFAYGYAPWHYPYAYYGYYSPLYATYYHYPHFPVWRPYGGYCSYHGGHCRPYGWHDSQDRHDRLAKDGRRKRGRKDKDDLIPPVDDQDSPADGNRNGEEPFTRYAMTPAYGYGGSQGLLVNSGETEKIGKSRTQPISSSAYTNGIVIRPSPFLTGVNSSYQATAVAPANSYSTRSTNARPTSSSSPHRSASHTPRASAAYSSRPRASMRSSSRGTSRGKYSPVRQKRD